MASLNILLLILACLRSYSAILCPKLTTLRDLFYLLFLLSSSAFRLFWLRLFSSLGLTPLIILILHFCYFHSFPISHGVVFLLSFPPSLHVPVVFSFFFVCFLISPSILSLFRSLLSLSFFHPFHFIIATCDQKEKEHAIDVCVCVVVSKNYTPWLTAGSFRPHHWLSQQHLLSDSHVAPLYLSKLYFAMYYLFVCLAWNRCIHGQKITMLVVKCKLTSRSPILTMESRVNAAKIEMWGSFISSSFFSTASVLVAF